MPVTTTTAVEGSTGITEEEPAQGLVVAVGGGENCMYDGGPGSVAGTEFPSGDITGPYNLASLLRLAR